MLTTIEIEPKTSATHAVIWLHGLGASGDDFVPIVPELHLPADLAVRFIFPHAPVRAVTINNGYEMRAWFDIFGLQLDSAVDTKGIADSTALVEELIQQQIQRGIPLTNIILAGFSQGAVMALTIGLRRQEALGGIIALSGFFPLAEETLKLSSISSRNTPIFLAHGTEDMIVAFTLGKMSYQLLKEGGCNASWHAYPMGHSVCGEEIRDISEWMKGNMSCG
jgi:phospholipase/carboxylesterase